MIVVPGATCLALEADAWIVQLRDGSEIEVLAHGYSIEDDHCVFSLLFEGNPNFEVTSLRMPMSLLPDGFR